MVRNILGQAFYMVLFSLVILFAGTRIFMLPGIKASTPFYVNQAYLDYLNEEEPDYVSKYGEFKIGDPTSKLIIYSILFHLTIVMLISLLFIRRFGPIQTRSDADTKGSIRFFVTTNLILLGAQICLI